MAPWIGGNDYVEVRSYGYSKWNPSPEAITVNDTEIPDSTWLAKILESSRLGGDPERDHAGVDAVFAVWLTGDAQETVNARMIRGRAIVPGRPGISLSAEAVTEAAQAIDMQMEIGDAMDDGPSVPAAWRAFIAEAG
ncbi:hypothetical protein AFCDBAGC_1051 [Methylobacterium cerastii]|uniref:Uncharacterized protein n=1 Tax=Methylobacterium cerastii TaxID=932741 RepID=A0ABQ4QEQ4_9HYPH|nr:hypothetical protein AFCDBAGC_1051 [Methylobacterium cerastii]